MSDLDGGSRPTPNSGKGNLLFLTQRIPFPPIKGEKIRPLQILKYLGKSYNIYLGCLIDDPRDWQHVETIRMLCADAHFARVDHKTRALAYLSGIAMGLPLSVSIYRNRGLAHWISQVLHTVQPSIIFVCSSNMAPYVLDYTVKDCVRIVDLADVDSEKWRAYAEKNTGIMKWVYSREARLVSDLERRIAYETDASTFCTEAEANLFRGLFPERASAIHGISSGVDFDYFDPSGNYPPVFDVSLPNYVFTGTMDYLPNVDAVTWFSRYIFPIIRQKLPDSQFYIVGSNPSPHVLRLATIDGVHVTGRVPDVRPYLAHATAAVAPMQIARGIQNKVLEAMAMARPVIVTPEALEGIEAIPGEEVVLADSAESFAAAAYALTTGSKSAAIGAAARRRVLQFYNWNNQLSQFDQIIARPGLPEKSSHSPH